MQDPAIDQGVCLSEAEAIALLELIISYPRELDPEQRAAFDKLSEYCRQLLRAGDDSLPPLCPASKAALASTLAA